MTVAALRLLRMLVVVGCAWSPAPVKAQGQPAPPPSVAVEEQRVAVAPAARGMRDDHPAHDRIASLSVQDQRAALLPLVRATDGGCEAIAAAYFAGIDATGLAYWDVRCHDRTGWRIALARDGGVADLILCGRQARTCFVPVPRVPGDLSVIQQARCNAACDLRSGAARQACIVRCLQGNEEIAGVGGGGNDRYLAVAVADLTVMTEGFLAAGQSAAAARQAAGAACAAVAGAAACRLAVAAFNACVAVVQAPDGLISPGTGIELDDAEREAQASCGRGATCQVVVSGC
jgi:hypothetical protein